MNNIEEFAQSLENFLNLKLSHKQRYQNYRKMQEIYQKSPISLKADTVPVIFPTNHT